MGKAFMKIVLPLIGSGKSDILNRRKLLLPGFFIFIWALMGCSRMVFQTEGMKLSLDNHGCINEILIGPDHENNLLTDSVSHFLTLYSDGRRHIPVSVSFNRSEKLLRFTFREPVFSVEVRLSEKGSYLTFEVVRAEPAARIEAIQWGPLFTTISKKSG